MIPKGFHASIAADLLISEYEYHAKHSTEKDMRKRWGSKLEVDAKLKARPLGAYKYEHKPVNNN